MAAVASSPAGIFHGKVEGATSVDSAFGPGASTVALNDACHDGQPDPRAGELVFPMQAREGLEQRVGVGHREASAVIPHKIRRLATDLRDTQLNDGVRSLTGEFPGVAEQVLQSDPEQPGIAADGELRRDRNSTWRS
jgi:hypothetical protein